MSTNDALVFCIIFAYPCWAFYQMARDEMNSFLAQRSLPELATELNLTHKKGGRLGSYSGIWNEHHICISPHEGSAVSIKVKCRPGFAASHIVYSQFPPLNWVGRVVMQKIDPDSWPNPQFSFGDPLLDDYLQQRELSDQAGAEIASNQLIHKALRDFVNRNHFSASGLSIGNDVGCRLWTGGSCPVRAASVTAKQVRIMLDEMMPIVKAIEEANNEWENS